MRLELLRVVQSTLLSHSSCIAHYIIEFAYFFDLKMSSETVATTKTATAGRKKSDTSSAGPPAAFELPSTCINRLVKSVLAPSIVVGKEAKSSFSKAASVWILYVTAA